jgi:hypothetical protein
VLGGPVVLLGRLGENGPNDQWADEEKNIQYLKLIARFGKLITENLVAEITGKNSQKIVGN